MPAGSAAGASSVVAGDPMSGAKRQKTGAGGADMVPSGRGLLCISLDSQTVEGALQAMSGAFRCHCRAAGGRGLSTVVS